MVTGDALGDVVGRFVGGMEGFNVVGLNEGSLVTILDGLALGSFVTGAFEGLVVVGSVDGDNVGIALGEREGALLGTSVGEDEGGEDGEREGPLLGDTVGEEEGGVDGESEGTLLGDAVGENEGCFTGERVGSLEGSPYVGKGVVGSTCRSVGDSLTGDCVGCIDEGSCVIGLKVGLEDGS